MQSNYSTAKGASTHRKRYRNNGYTDHDNPLHRPGGGGSKAGLDQTFAKEAASDQLLHKEAPAAAPTPLGRPAINRWAIDTGPRLDLTHRVVLREIARYADDAPKTITVNGLLVHLEAGECCPTQETLAEGLDATDRTIRNSVRNLRGLGLLSTRPMPGADGKRLIYRLAGVDAGWQPAPKNERESRPIIAAYRILAEGQVQSLEEAHRRIAYLESLLNERYGHPAATATGGDGTQPNQTGPDPETVAADELPNRNVVPVQLPNPTGPAPETVATDELSNQNEIPVQQPDPTGPAPETAAEAELPNRNYVPVHQPATEERNRADRPRQLAPIEPRQNLAQRDQRCHPLVPGASPGTACPVGESEVGAGAGIGGPGRGETGQRSSGPGNRNHSRHCGGPHRVGRYPGPAGAGAAPCHL